jgi:hypothetical protein
MDGFLTELRVAGTGLLCGAGFMTVALLISRGF